MFVPTGWTIDHSLIEYAFPQRQVEVTRVDSNKVLCRSPCWSLATGEVTLPEYWKRSVGEGF
jgi:hypothetical protein